ncbi:MAG: hypothetical protein ACI9F9_002989 [Candidatus Paceibacteria bacterium]|jgi:hypothetical protein
MLDAEGRRKKEEGRRKVGPFTRIWCGEAERRHVEERDVLVLLRRGWRRSVKEG